MPIENTTLTVREAPKVTSSIGPNFHKIWTAFQASRVGVDRENANSLADFFSSITAVAENPASAESIATQFSTNRHEMSADNLREIAKLVGSFQESIETIDLLSEAWYSSEDQSSRTETYSDDSPRERRIHPETKAKWQQFNQELVNLYIAGESSTDKDTYKKVKAISRLLSPTGENVEVSGGKEMSNRDLGARVHAGIAIGLKEKGYKILLPNSKDPVELSLWENNGVDMAAYSPEGVLVFIDSKSKTIASLDGKSVENVIIEVTDREDRRKQSLMSQIAETCFETLKVPKEKRNGYSHKEIGMPTQTLRRPGVLARFQDSEVNDLIEKLKRSK